MKPILSCVLCLIAGLLIGRLLPNGATKSDAADHAATLDQKNSQKIRSDQSDGESLRSLRRSTGGSTEHTPSDDTSLNDSAEHGKLVTIPSHMIEMLASKVGTRSLDQELFSNDGHDEAALQITDREKSQIQQAWRMAGAKVKKLEAGAASYKDLPDGSVQIIVPDLSDSMETLGGSFKAATKDVLGENRAEAFLAMKQVRHIFDMQQGSLTCTVKMESVGDGQWRYTIRHGRGEKSTTQWVTRTIPSALRHLTDKAGIQSKLQPPPEESEE